VFFQAVEQRPVIRRGGRRLIEYNDIDTADCRPVLSERLPDNALQPVASGREATVLLANRQAQSWLGRAVWPIKNSKQVIAAALGFRKDATEGRFID